MKRISLTKVPLNTTVDLTTQSDNSSPIPRMPESLNESHQDGRVSVGERVAALDLKVPKESPSTGAGVAARAPGSKVDTKKKAKVEVRTCVADPLADIRAMGSFCDRMAEAAALKQAVNTSMASSRNLRTDIKKCLVTVVDRLVDLLREAEREREKERKGKSGKCMETEKGKGIEERKPDEERKLDERKIERMNEHIERMMKEQMKLLEETNREVKAIRQDMQKMPPATDGGVHRDDETLCKELRGLKETILEAGRLPSAMNGVTQTYAEAVAKPRGQVDLTPKHSIIVTSETATETGENVVDRVRTALCAKENGIRIQRIRKARDAKVVISCPTQQELSRATEHIKAASGLKVEPARNKHPLVILRNLLAYNSDDDILKALKSQNKHLLEGLTAEEAAVEVRYRRRARNSLECNAVLRTAPKLWQRLTAAGRLYIDIQQVRVEDWSPLVQCTKCLAFGHGRRACLESEDLCNYCGDKHKRAECPAQAENKQPSCINCKRARHTSVDHTVYSGNCPVRRKWDALARATTAYC